MRLSHVLIYCLEAKTFLKIKFFITELNSKTLSGFIFRFLLFILAMKLIILKTCLDSSAWFYCSR